MGGEAWFQKAQTAKDIVFSDIHVSPDLNLPVVTMAKAYLTPDGNVYSVLVVDLDADLVTKRVTGLKVGKTGVAYILGKDGTVLATRTRARTSSSNLARSHGARRSSRREGLDHYSFEGKARFASYQDTRPWGGSL